MDQQLHVEVYDYDEDGTHDFIGSFTATLRELSTRINHEYLLINPKKYAS